MQIFGRLVLACTGKAEYYATKQAFYELQMRRIRAGAAAGVGGADFV